MPQSDSTREAIEAARLAQLVAHYEANGWPAELVRLLNARPTVTLAEALAGFTIPAKAVA